jgi:tetratricopeptide (TPR) repeat protein
VILIRLVGPICLLSCVSPLTPTAAADTYQMILKGRVMMKDGSPPPSTAGIQRHCSDGQGSAPGPLTNKKGEFLWRMDVDNMLTRVCTLEASIIGYDSTRIDISNLNAIVTNIKELPPMILTRSAGDPRIVKNTDEDVPLRAHAEWKAAMKSGDANNFPEMVDHLRGVVAAEPKFAKGWHTLGIACELLQKPADARDAYLHATQADPKSVISFVTLSRMDVVTKDWQGAQTAAQTAIKLDPKQNYSEVYLHLAVARYELKDLPGAEASAKEAIARGGKANSRAEFVLGRVLDAKGDSAGAREHIATFLAENPTAPDAELIKNYMDIIGKPEAGALNPDLELP